MSKYIPVFTVDPGDENYIFITLDPGITVRVAPSQLNEPSDLFDTSDPWFSVYFTLYVWMRDNQSLPLGNYFLDAAIRSNYATYVSNTYGDA